jgi:hypothetical protein
VRSRPLVEVLHAGAVVGRPLGVRVALTGRSRTPIDLIEIGLSCVETSVYGYGKGRRRYRATHVDERLSFDGLVLEAGAQHAIDVEIPTPAAAPPSYAGRELGVTWTLTVHAVIPWWPDLRRKYVLDFARAPGSLPRPELIVACSQAGGPSPGRLYLEATLASTEVAPGEIVAGRVSLDHVEAARVRGLKVALVARERSVVPRRVNEGEVRRWEARVHEGAPASGASIPFQVRLPLDAPPSLRGGLGALEWSVEAIADLAFAIDKKVAMPLLVEPALPGRARQKAAPAYAPLVGRERRTMVWEAVAKRAGLDHERDEERMSGTVGQVHVDVGVDERDRAVATLRWAPLGLALRVRQRRGLRGLGRGMPEGPVWTPQFARAFVVEVRDARQIVELLADEVQRQLVNAHGGVSTVELDDEGARLETTSAPQSERALATLVLGYVLPLARAVDTRLDRVPAPEVTWPRLGAWRAFADAYKGRLETGRLFVHGASIGGDLVDVGLEWDGCDEARGTRVRLRLPSTLREPVRVDAAERDGRLRATGKKLVADLAAVGEDLRIGPATIELVLPQVVLDPRATLPLVETMARLARLLVGTPAVASPYR